MSYNSFRKHLNIGSYINDIYVEVRNWENIVGFFDSQARLENSEIKSDRLALLLAFNRIAPSYLIEYDSPFENITISNLNGEVRAITKKQLKTFIEKLENVKLSGRLPRPPRYPDSMSAYSVWHYSLDYNCLCRDIDYTEYRNNEIVAFIETTGKLKDVNHIRNSIGQIRSRLDLQIRIMNQLSIKFNVPSFITIHTTDLSYFEVYDLLWNKILIGNKESYAQWLAEL